MGARSRRRQGGRSVDAVKRLRAAIEPLETRTLLTGATEDPPAIWLPESHYLQASGGYLTQPAKGTPLNIALNYLSTHAGQLGLVPADLVNPVVTDQYTDADTGITHIYLRQRFNNLPVLNANLNVNVTRDGRVLNVGGGFVAGTVNAAKLAPKAPTVTAQQAIDAVRGYARVGADQAVTKEAVGNVEGNAAFSVPSVSLDPVVPSLFYVATAGGMNLAWNLSIRTPDNQHWYDLNVDATTGVVLSGNDWMDHATYDVYATPTEAPNDGPGGVGTRTVVTDPYDPVASPFGWHDTNGVAGPEYTDTRGNNVSAQEDTNADNAGGFRPSGGSSLNFDFPVDLSQSPSVYQSAAITNLFYWVNLAHDVHYRYGFTEAAGNFQTLNYTGQGLGNDAVFADAQDGSGVNNANFSSPPDGQAGRMQMYLFNKTTPGRDGDLDAEIILHEYGHGVSNRLTGGPANANALATVQSAGMGEGWSDWWGLMLTMKSTDLKTGKYPVGTYVLGQSTTTGAGIRRYPYAFDMTVDPLTLNYFNTDSSHEVHNTGEIWTSVLWDMSWLLVDKYGFSGDYAHGYDPNTPGLNGGNNLALQLVTDALKLQPANPSFLQARDAILQADQVRTGGANKLQIWTAFARRGMGYSAVDSSSSATSVTPAYDLPPDLIKPRVASHTPIGVRTTPVTSIDFTFSKAMNPGTFSIASDVVSFTGPGGVNLLGTITGSSWLNGNTTLRVSFAAPTADGQYTMVIGPQILSADDGTAMDQNGDGTAGQSPQDRYTATFSYDSLQLAVVSTTPASGSSVMSPFTTLDVHFNEPVLASTIGTNDLTLSQGSVTGAAQLDATTVRYTLSGITAEGTVTINMAAGALTDVNGFPMAAYTGTFGVDFGTQAFPPTKAESPLGSQVYDTSASGSIGIAGDTDSFTITLDPGQSLTGWVVPAAALQATLTVLDPLGATVATASAAAGKECIIQAVATTGGVYTLVVGGAAGTTGAYTVNALLNAAVESEAHGGASNGTRATAQSLDAAFTGIGATGSRTAVLGFGGTGSAGLITADFTSGANGFVVNNTGGGLWHLSTGHGADAGHSASQSFYYGTGETATGGGTYNTGSTNTGTLTSPSFVVPAASASPVVNFNYILKTEGSTSYDLAQLQIFSGGTWTTLASYNGTAESATWKAATPVSLSAYAGQTVQIRFYFNTVDSVGNTYEGWYVDDVAVSAAVTDDDYYSVTLKAGDVVTLAAAGASALTLMDANGNTLATGAAGATNLSSVVTNFVVPASGVYYAKVSATAGVAYTLVATKNASFDTEPNDSLAAAQNITTTKMVVGAITPSSTLAPSASDDFETGVLGPAWSTYRSDATYGRIQVASTQGAGSGVYAMLMDNNNSTGSTYNLNEAVWSVNLAGVSTATLSFYQISFADEADTLPASWAGHYNGDGVSISADGNTWYRVWQGGTSTTWTQVTVDLAAAATSAGIPLSSVTKVKFQQYDNYPISTDGRGYDKVVLSTPASGDDYYSIQLAAGEAIHLSTSTPAGGPAEFANALDPAIDLYDPAGNLVASNDNGALDGRNAVIDYVAATAGLYKVRVRGVGGSTGEYVLDAHQYVLPNGATGQPDLLAASDTGLSAADNVTRFNNATPATALQFTIPGTLPGATVTLYCDGSPVASAVATSYNTLLTLDGSTVLADGSHTFVARQTPAGGTESPDSVSLMVTVATAAPTAPAAPVLQAGSDSGVSNSDGITNVKTPTFNVAAGPYFRVYRDGVLISGNYESGSTYTVPTLADGTYTFTVTVVDAAGNESAPSVASSPVTIDTVAPTAPTAAPDLQDASDSGVSATDNVTNVNLPTFNVTAASPYFRLYRGSTLVSDAYLAGSSVTTSGIQPDGTYAFTLRAVDAAGNESAAGPAISVTIDTVAPATPVAPDLDPASDGGLSNTDNITNVTAPTFIVAGAPYFRFLRDGVLVSASYQSGTTYTSATLADGTYAFSVVAVDAAGNVSAASAPLAVTVDSTILQAPTLYAGSDTGVANNDHITSANNASPATALTFFVSNTTTGATVTLYADGVPVASVVSAGATAVLTTDGATAFPDGVHVFSARQALPGMPQTLDSNPLSVTVDTIAPAAPPVPDLLAASDTGVSSTDDITSNRTPTFTVTGTTYYRLFVNGAQVTGDYQTGNFVLPARSDGTYTITAVAVDAAGNVSPLSAGMILTIDTVEPLPPTAALDLQAASDSGVSSTDNITNDNTPTFDLPALPAGAYYRVYRDGTLISGSYQTGPSFTAPTLADGTYNFTVSVVDAAGNVSLQGPGLSVTIDTVAPVAPAAPDLRASSDSGVSNSDNVTNVTNPTIDVTAGDFGTLHFETDGSNGTGPTVATVPGGTYSFTAGATNLLTMLPQPSLGTGPSARAVAAGDINGDGYADLAVTNTTAKTITILLNDGAGGFLAPIAVQVPYNACFVTIGDFNKDGRGDLIYIDLSQHVQLLQGNGDGTFRTPVSLTSYGTPLSIQSVDLNGDGNLDLLFGYSDGVRASLGRGDGTFGPILFSPTNNGSAVLDFSVADFDRNGIPDVVTRDTTTGIQVLLGNGDGTFTYKSAPAVPYCTFVSAGDLNGDGAADIIATVQTSPYVGDAMYVFLGNGDGTFKSPTVRNFIFSDGATSGTVMADFNQDGRLDAAVALSSYGNSHLTLFLGNGDGTLQAPSSYAVSEAFYPVTADFNHDGLPDVVSLDIDGSRLNPFYSKVTAGLTDGTHTFTAWAEDLAGNRSANTPTLSVTIDTVAPTAPAVAPDLTTASDTGVSSTDNITNATTQTFTLATSTGLYARVFRNGTQASTDYVSGSSFTAGGQTDGTAIWTQAYVDAAGNVSAPGPTLSVTTVTVPPSAPTAAPDLQAASDSGVSSTDNITNVTTPTFDLPAAPAGLYARVFRDGVVQSALYSSASTYTSPALADGVYSFALAFVDAAGNVSALGPSLTVTVDTAAPAVPAAPDLQAASDSGISSSDNITNVTTPTFDVAAGGAPYFRFYRNGALVSGGYQTGPSFTAPALADGTYNFTVAAVDVAGNVSTQSAVLSVTIDTNPYTPGVFTGQFDSTFGGTGSVIAPFANQDAPAALAVQPDGKVIIGGFNYTYGSRLSSNLSTRFELIRLNPDGSLDTSFGSAGHVLTPLLGKDEVHTLLILPDGKILAGGTAGIYSGGSGWQNRWAMVRYNSDGSVDTTFGSAGSVIATTGTVGSIGSLALLPGGKILAGGDYLGALRFIRYNPNGSVDTTFGSAGVATVSAGGNSIFIDMQVLPSGQIVAAADMGGTSGPFKFGVARINADGSPDTSFGTNGVSLLSSPGALNNNAGGFAVQADGKLLVSGVTQVPSSLNYAAVARFNPDGSPDTAFGAGGFLTYTGLPGNSSFGALLLQPDAKILAFGSTNGNAAVVRFNPDGSPDTSLGSGTGYVMTPVPGATTGGPVAAAYANGTIITAGLAGLDAAADFYASRFLITPLPPPDLASASDSGISNSDNITNVTAPTFNLSTPSGYYYRVYRNGLQVSANYGSGTSFTAPTQADGTAAWTTAFVDAAGNLSPQSASLSVTIDTVAPAAPALAPDLQAASDSGASSTDNVTNVKTPTFDLATPAGTYFRFYNGGTQVTGNYQSGTTFTSPSLADGTYSFTAAYVDAAGNVSAQSPALTVTIDTVAPDQPNAPYLNPTNDTGLSNSDGITNISAPIINIAITTPYFRLYENGVLISSTYQTGYSVTLPTHADGTYMFTLVAIDAAGNASPMSAAGIVTIDTVAPAAPPIPDLKAASDSGRSNSDNVTNNNTPTVDVTAPESGLLQVTMDGSLFTSFTATGPATFSFGAYPAPTYVSSPVTLPSSARAGIAEDFDYDFHTDLAYISASDPTLYLVPGLGGGSFGPAISVPLPDASPLRIVAADLNADGMHDLVILHSSSLTILYHLPYGSSGQYGPFAAPISMSIEPGSTAVAVADFNNDGYSDIATLAGTTLRVRYGHYGGSFTVSTIGTVAATSFPFLVAADVDHNTLPDLIAPNFVLLSRYEGTFSAPLSFSASGIPRDVVIADFNNDGNLDLVYPSVVGTTARLNFLAGFGNGTFDTPLPVPLASGASPSSILAADLNHDGILDLITTTNTGVNQGVFVSPGDGQGMFGPATRLSTTASAIVLGAGDFDGGGMFGLIAGSSTSPSVSLFSYKSVLPDGSHTLTARLMDVAGNISPVSPTLTITVDTVAPAAPGAPDLQAGSDSGTSNSDNLTNVTSPVIDLSATAPGFLHLTIDGVSGLPVSVPAAGTYPVAATPPPPLTYSRNTYSTPAGSDELASADFNGDGRKDLVVSAYNGVSILLGNGDGSFTYTVAIPASDTRGVVTGDFNADGKADFAVNVGGTSLRVYLGNGNGTFQTPASYPIDPGDLYYEDHDARYLRAADLNNDGRLDIVSTCTGDCLLFVFLGQPDGSFQPVPTTLAFGGPEFAIGDINGDGNADLVIDEVVDSVVITLLGNGDGTFQQSSNFLVPQDVNSIAIADLNNDGKNDLLFTANGSSSVFVYLSYGSGSRNSSFQPVKIWSDPGSQFNQVVVADLDGDGYLDIAATDATGPAVRVARGNGDGTFQPASTLTGIGASPAHLIADQFNTDGRPDFAIASESGSISVLVSTIIPPATLTDGTHTFTVWFEDLAGNRSPDSAPLTITVDTTPPAVAADALTTIDTTPPLSGSVDDPTAAVVITLNGANYAATNNGDGTWTLADNALPPLPAGATNFAVTATDPAGNASTTTASVTVLPPPSLVTWVVNDGSAQRSMVKTVTLVFDQPVSLAAGAVELRTHDASATLVPLTLANPAGDGRTFILSFSGTLVSAGSLADGVYDLTLHNNKVHDLFGRTPIGADPKLTFHRLFGDSNGDKTVDSTDIDAFAAAQASKSPAANYRWYFDIDQDQDVDAVDALIFRQHQGQSVFY